MPRTKKNFNTVNRSNSSYITKTKNDQHLLNLTLTWKQMTRTWVYLLQDYCLRMNLSTLYTNLNGKLLWKILKIKRKIHISNTMNHYQLTLVFVNLQSCVNKQKMTENFVIFKGCQKTTFFHCFFFFSFSYTCQATPCLKMKMLNNMNPQQKV